jgi:hypothetical protein
MGNKKFEFTSSQKGILPIEPTKNVMPEWFKNIPSFNEKNIQFDENLPVKSAKNCIAFLDSFTSGYVIKLWRDVHVEKMDNGLLYLRWPISEDKSSVVHFRNNSNNNNIPTPAGHSNERVSWNLPYVFKLPPGYSALFTHPLNRFDLPFTTMSGIIDLDGGMYEGNLPFFIKSDFVGLIPAGTPIAQIIPFKRDDWKITNNTDLIKQTNILLSMQKTKFYNWYKNNLWKKKKYE